MLLFFLSNSCITTIISEYEEYVFVTEASAVQQNYSDGTKTQIINIINRKTHSKCIKCFGFSHARDAVYGISKCKFCENFRLITLRSSLRLVRRNHPSFPVAPQRPPRPLVRPRPGVRMLSSRRWRVSRQASPFLYRARAHDYLFPSSRARDTVSFGLDDILQTAASDSEDFGPALADALPPARPSAAYSELVDVLSRATEKLALDWPDKPRQSRASKLDERFLSGANSKPEWRKLPFFSDLHQEISRS